jgi:putative membrane protein
MESSDSNAPIPLDTTTRLAIERTRVAYERTVMAAIRTATSLITFGFSAYKFFQMDLFDGRNARPEAKPTLLGPKEFGLTLIALGLLSLMVAWLEYHRDIKTLRREYPAMPRSNIGIIACVVALVGSGLLVIVLLND